MESQLSPTPSAPPAYKETEEPAIPVKFVPAPTLTDRLRSIDITTWLLLLAVSFLFCDVTSALSAIPFLDVTLTVVLLVFILIDAFLLYAAVTNKLWALIINEVYAVVFLALTSLMAGLVLTSSIFLIFFAPNVEDIKEFRGLKLSYATIVKLCICSTVASIGSIFLCILRHKLLRAVRRRIQHEKKVGRELVRLRRHV